jgi:hypothetical protein
MQALLIEHFQEEENGTPFPPKKNCEKKIKKMLFFQAGDVGAGRNVFS